MTNKLLKPTRHRGSRFARGGVIRHIAFLVSALGILFAGELTSAGSDEPPEAPAQYVQGKEKFQSFCAECHGQWAEGTEQGPPLLHVYYVEGHHTNQAFYRAILQGSRQHHWDSGDVPPVAGATIEDARQVTEFVRWLQAERGVP